MGRGVEPLTCRHLVVDDRKAAVHAGRQEQVALERVPLEPPHPALHGNVRQRPPQAPRVPEENMLVIAETHGSQPVCGKAGLRGQGTPRRRPGPTLPGLSRSLSPRRPHSGSKSGLVRRHSGHSGHTGNGRRSQDSPSRGQDVLMVGAALDAAHAHGVSAGGGGEQAPCSSPTEARGGGLSRQKQGGAGAGQGRGGWPHEDLPAAAEGGSVGRPGVPALQEAIVPTCTEMETTPAGQEAR